MKQLWFYDLMSRRVRLNYRLKIMLVAFVGTHVPLISVAAYVAIEHSPNWTTFIGTMAVTLTATLGGTGVTLFVLNELLKPVLLTSRTLKTYRESREVGELPRHYSDEVGTLMANAGDTIEHLEVTRDRLEHIDETTGLPNRRQLQETMQAMIAGDRGFVVSAIRFPDYSRIATTFDSGQAELMADAIARRIASELSDGEVLARVGPVVFAFVKLFDGAADDAARVAGERLADMLGRCGGELTIGQIEVAPMLQGGVATFPSDGDEVEAVLDNAIAAAGQSKPSSPVVIHSGAARDKAKARFQLEHELRRALAEGQLSLHYQPVVDLGRARVAGAEALLRWQHPDRGMVSPGEFIPIAESSGLIEPIGLWVLGEACRQARAWEVAGMSDMRVAVNLSARQFLDENLLLHIRETLEGERLRPDLLEIELTETAAMVDHDHTKRVFTELRDLGVGIAIDDFGTGYASMSYLRKLPFNKLKIDREFVTDVHQRGESQAICNALIALSKGLGLKILAEGTEKEAEVNYLHERGCDTFQGFYFSRPLPAASFDGAVNSAMLRELHERMKGERPEAKFAYATRAILARPASSRRSRPGSGRLALEPAFAADRAV